MAPLVLVLIKVLFKSFLPTLLGYGGDQQRFLAGPFDLDFGTDGFAGRGLAAGGFSGGNVVDGFALNRFVNGGFGETQFGGIRDPLNEQIVQDENELLEDESEIDNTNFDQVEEDDGISGKKNNVAQRRRRLNRLRNINVFR